MKSGNWIGVFMIVRSVAMVASFDCSLALSWACEYCSQIMAVWPGFPGNVRLQSYNLQVDQNWYISS